MKTAIAIPDEVYAEAERLVHRLNTSRSQLYTDAIREYVARHDPDAVTEALNRVCEQVDARVDPKYARVQNQAMEKQFASPSEVDSDEWEGWRAIRDAAATRRLGAGDDA